jgi:hypothetical protein
VFTRPLFFDYNDTAAVATAHFIKWHQAPAGHMTSPQQVKFLQDGQRVCTMRLCIAAHSRVCNDKHLDPSQDLVSTC